MRATSGEFYGKYAGRVVSNSDPLKLGRVKIRVPIIHGINGTNKGDLVGDEDLPWALPAGLPAGGSSESGGVSWIPVTDDQVWVEFLDGELDKPIWTWGNQNQPQAKTFGNLPLHKYDAEAAAQRSAFMRYDHWWELLPTGHDIWTKSGYHFRIIDEQTPGQPSGKFSWTTALGYLLSLDDESETLSVFAPHIEDVCQTESVSATESIDFTSPLVGINFGSIELGGNYQNFQIDGITRTSRGLRILLNQLTMIVTQDITVQSASINSTQVADITLQSASLNSTQISSTSFTAPTFGITSAAFSVTGPTGPGLDVTGPAVKLGLAAADPVVRLSDLVLALSLVKTIFDAHGHSGIFPGPGTTGPPTAPAVLTATGSASVFVEALTRTTLPVG